MMITPIKPAFTVISAKITKASRSKKVSLIPNISDPIIVRRVLNPKTILQFNDPDLYSLPQNEKEKFINDALYNDEPRLLQVIFNEIAKTNIGKKVGNYLQALHVSDKIHFEKDNATLPGHGKFAIHSLENNDVDIVIAKDAPISFLASTLIHEVTHFIDFKKTLNGEINPSSFELETHAFSNEHQFLLEGDYIKSFYYVMFGEDAKSLMEKSYRYMAQGERHLKSEIMDALEYFGYRDLGESAFLRY